MSETGTPQAAQPGGEERRRELVALLSRAEAPLSGASLADLLGVSRQVIVQDVALLRRDGIRISSTNRGYVLGERNRHVRSFKVRHGREGIEEELNLMVDAGGTVEDVIVNHRTYGRISCRLGVSSRRDVRRYLDELDSGLSEPLCTLTSGYHFHHVSATSEEALDEIERGLASHGFLADRLPWEVGGELD